MTVKRNDFYERYLRELPEGLTQTVGKLLLRFRGENRSVSRSWLVSMVAVEMKFVYENQKEFANLDRRVRRAIEILRGSGWLIGSTVSGDGYYICQTWDEYMAFRASYTSAAYKVIETAKLMDRHALQQLGSDAQLQPALISEG